MDNTLSWDDWFHEVRTLAYTLYHFPGWYIDEFDKVELMEYYGTPMTPLQTVRDLFTYN